ncbi:hypothetical protein BRARA_J01005 [Brassica rapa]|uniref:Uncharacterized protein n=1 Tax=Brassica campestris TaxID=3711 RepID=A0A397XSN7_BRACM|nr:hypothetical protein BRARA_J01005 [Brassica rapa]
MWTYSFVPAPESSAFASANGSAGSRDLGIKFRHETLLI